MALTGLDIYKLLPKTNCGDCNVPTCLAFAMKLAQKKAELSECPHASDEAKSVLGAASEPPMRLLKIGTGADTFEIGGETEMFRHEKTFYHQTALGVEIKDSQDDDAISRQVQEAESYRIERVGENLHLDLFCLSNDSGDRDRFLAALKALMAQTSKTVILKTTDVDTMKAALEIMEAKRAILYPQTRDAAPYVAMAREAGASLIVSADSADDLVSRVEEVVQSGFREIILNLRPTDADAQLQINTILRRAALRKGFKTFGFPIAQFVEHEDVYELVADATLGICKYSGMLILPKFSRELFVTLFTLRQNIYTDPQKPIQVDAKLYSIGDPKQDSPVFTTTNFSLTYFIVSNEIENAGISAWLVVPDCEGMSVLTAWAAGKYSGEKIGKFVKEQNIEGRVSTRDLVIPGLVASISGELEEALPDWKVIVGPQEASDLAPFIKNYLTR